MGLECKMALRAFRKLDGEQSRTRLVGLINEPKVVRRLKGELVSVKQERNEPVAPLEKDNMSELHARRLLKQLVI